MSRYISNIPPEHLYKRTHKYAVQCAEHFQRLGKGLIKEKTTHIDFKKKSIEDINAWIAEVTSSLGIRQFNK